MREAASNHLTPLEPSPKGCRELPSPVASSAAIKLLSELRSALARP